MVVKCGQQICKLLATNFYHRIYITPTTYTHQLHKKMAIFKIFSKMSQYYQSYKGRESQPRNQFLALHMRSHTLNKQKNAISIFLDLFYCIKNFDSYVRNKVEQKTKLFIVNDLLEKSIMQQAPSHGMVEKVNQVTYPLIIKTKPTLLAVCA